LGSARAKASIKHVDEIDYWCQFHQRFRLAFFVQKLVQSQNVTRKKAYCAFNVDEIDHWT